MCHSGTVFLSLSADLWQIFNNNNKNNDFKVEFLTSDTRLMCFVFFYDFK